MSDQGTSSIESWFLSLHYKLVRIFKVITFRVKADNCFLRASSLTYHSILSFVPMLAVMFGVAKGFGLETAFEQSLLQEFKDQKEVITYLITFGYTLLEETRGGVVAGIGVLTLLFTILRLLSNVESSLNYMWGQKQSRKLSRKINDYLALTLICPIILTVSSSLTVFITGMLHNITENTPVVGQLSPITRHLIAIIPFLISTMLFTFLYIFIPNTHVRTSSALVAGICAGIAYQILQSSYISIQIQVTKFGAIYGSFAALPLFLVWLYFSWMIFLIGSEIVVIHQERLWDPKLFLPFRELSQFEKQMGYLAITKVSQDAFIQGISPVSVNDLSTTLKLPERTVSELIEDLIRFKVLIRTMLQDRECEGYVPAISPENLRIIDIIEATEGEHQIVFESQNTTMVQFERLLKALQALARYSDKNMLLKDISIL